MKNNIIKSIFRKGYFAIHDNFLSIVVFLVLILIAIIVAKSDIIISTNNINILLSIAAITSTFFMFLAFKESKKSNLLKIGELVYDDLNRKVEDVIKEGRGQLLTSTRIEELSRLSKFPKDKLEAITFDDFFYPMIELLRYIKRDSLYREFIKKFKSNYIILLANGDCKSAKRISRIFVLIQYAFSFFLGHYKNIHDTCLMINSAKIDRRHKQLLIQKLLSYSTEYDEVYLKFTNDNKLGKYIREFDIIAFDESKGNELKRDSFIFDEYFTSLYKTNQIINSLISDI